MLYVFGKADQNIPPCSFKAIQEPSALMWAGECFASRRILLQCLKPLTKLWVPRYILTSTLYWKQDSLLAAVQIKYVHHCATLCLTAEQCGKVFVIYLAFHSGSILHVQSHKVASSTSCKCLNIRIIYQIIYFLQYFSYWLRSILTC
jgi:hypothetical protein